MRNFPAFSCATLLALTALSIAACDSLPAIGGNGNNGEGGANGDGDGDGGIGIGDGDGDGGAGNDDDKKPEPEIEIHDTLPDGFTSSGSGDDDRGGWKVVGPWDEDTLKEDLTCGNILRVVARDFRSAHPDFQNGGTDLKQGIVGPEFAALGSDRKPVFVGVSGDNVNDQESFDTWYRNSVDGQDADTLPLNFVMDMWLQPETINGVENFVFDSSDFFPLAEMGYAESGPPDCPSDWRDDNSHRSEPDGCWGFLFTTELHTNFKYNGGEEFTFIGDDDVWVYINGKLAIDIGGVHGALSDTVVLDDVADELGIEVGKSYSLDMFQAERQTVQSNFRIQTTLDFSGCSEVVDDDGTIIR